MEMVGLDKDVRKFAKTQGYDPSKIIPVKEIIKLKKQIEDYQLKLKAISTKNRLEAADKAKAKLLEMKAEIAAKNKAKLAAKSKSEVAKFNLYDINNYIKK
jgi:hypothetical protein